MVMRLPEGFFVDPDDPRAPSEEAWARMTDAERKAVVASLPADVPFELNPSEGDPHQKATIRARQTLDSFFKRIGRKVYVSSNLGVYYPGEPRFAPDVIAVCDVEPHERMKWVVNAEKKGLDFVLEIHASGDRAKDLVRNVERYARLGIPEYFVLDVHRRSITGYRLPQSAGRRAYKPIVPQAGRYSSEKLKLELTIEAGKLRFLVGMATVPEEEELIGKLEAALGEALAARTEESTRAEEEARLREEAERALAEARAEIERLRNGG